MSGPTCETRVLGGDRDRAFRRCGAPATRRVKVTAPPTRAEARAKPTANVYLRPAGGMSPTHEWVCVDHSPYAITSITVFLPAGWTFIGERPGEGTPEQLGYCRRQIAFREVGRLEYRREAARQRRFDARLLRHIPAEAAP